MANCGSTPKRVLTFPSLSTIELARYLLGKVLCRDNASGVTMSGRIVETEAYLGGDDLASHSARDKRTPRNEPMYMPAGTVYVYFTYGMYSCFNISSQESGGAVLIRALEPLSGIEQMELNRSKLRRSSKVTKLRVRELCSGPSKLCQAMLIERPLNKISLFDAEQTDLWLEDDFYSVVSIVEAKRIGISKCDGWEDKLYRFYEKDSLFISRK